MRTVRNGSYRDQAGVKGWVESVLGGVRTVVMRTLLDGLLWETNDEKISSSYGRVCCFTQLHYCTVNSYELLKLSPQGVA